MTKIEHDPRLTLTPFPEPGRARRDLAVARAELASSAVAEGDQAEAAQLIEASLRAGLWRYSKVWLGFSELDESHLDYRQLRALWLESPKGCRSMRSAVFVVARAAAVSGDQAEAQDLLRKLTILAAQHRKRFISRMKSLFGGSGIGELPIPSLDTDDGSAVLTKALFDLFAALDHGSRDQVDQALDTLRDLGESDWLERI